MAYCVCVVCIARWPQEAGHAHGRCLPGPRPSPPSSQDLPPTAVAGGEELVRVEGQGRRFWARGCRLRKESHERVCGSHILSPEPLLRGGFTVHCFSFSWEQNVLCAPSGAASAFTVSLTPFPIALGTKTFPSKVGRSWVKRLFKKVRGAALRSHARFAGGAPCTASPAERRAGLGRSAAIGLSIVQQTAADLRHRDAMYISELCMNKKE